MVQLTSPVSLAASISMADITQLIRGHLDRLPQNRSIDSWIVAESALEGRGLFATRDIQQGELIFVDYPLIMGSRVSSKEVCRCVSCYRNDIPTKHCTRNCGLSVCSDKCQDSISHKEECELINSWLKKEVVDDMEFSKNLVPLRALLLNEEQKKFLRCLAAHDSPRHGMEVQFIKRHFEISYEEEELMLQACRALDTNAYAMLVKVSDKDDVVSLRGLFPTAALVNHSCLPNVRTSFDDFGNMSVVANRLIPAGSEIFTTYTGLFWGTPARRHHLLNTKHFSCTCKRCSDPTECGTKLSALRCLNRECPGLILPCDSLNTYSKWSCGACYMEVDACQVASLQAALASFISGLKISSPQSIYDFLHEKLLTFLPECNHIVFDLKCRILWLIGEAEGFGWDELSEEWLEIGERLCKECLEVCECLQAGGSSLAARLHYRLHLLLVQDLRKNHNEDKLKRAVASILKSHDILKNDSQAPEELERRRKMAIENPKALLDIII